MRNTALAVAMAGVIAAGTSSVQATELTGSVWFPDTHPLTQYGYVEWAKKVEEASGGDLTIRVFTGTALLPAAAHLSGLRDGLADLTYHAGTYTPADLPEDNVLAILGIALQDNIVIASAVSDFYMNDPAMRDMFDRHGIVFLGGYATPPYVLMCTEKVETLDEIRGKRIRMPGAIHAEFADAVDAVAVSVPSTEMFTGLERGQLDCAANAANDLKARSLWDVAKHVTTIDFGSYFAGWLWAANADSWRGLSDEERQVLMDTISDAVIDTSLGYSNQAEEALAEAPDHGVTIYEPADDLLEALREFNEQQMPEVAVREGSERFGIEDTEGLIERFEATVAKWQDIYADIDRNDTDALKEALRENLYGQVDVSTYGS